jgi:hypothetical protein
MRVNTRFCLHERVGKCKTFIDFSLRVVDTTKRKKRIPVRRKNITDISVPVVVCFQHYSILICNINALCDTQKNY